MRQFPAFGGNISSGDEMFAQPTCPDFATERDVTTWVSCNVNAGEVQRKASERKPPASAGVGNFSQTRIHPHSPKQKCEIALPLFIYNLTPESHGNLGFALKNFVPSFFIQSLNTLMLLKMWSFLSVAHFSVGWYHESLGKHCKYAFWWKQWFWKKLDCKWHCEAIVFLFCFGLASSTAWSQSMAVIFGKNSDY